MTAQGAWKAEVMLRLEPGAVRAQTPNPLLSEMLEAWGHELGATLSVHAEAPIESLFVLVANGVADALRRLEPEAGRPGHGFAVAACADALALAVVELDRPHYAGPFPVPVWDQFLRTLAVGAGLTLHVDVLRGVDLRNQTEAALRAFARALRTALGAEPSARAGPGFRGRAGQAGPGGGASDDMPPEVDVAGAALLTPAALAGASDEVRQRVRRRELPEVKAAKERDREIHGEGQGS